MPGGTPFNHNSIAYPNHQVFVSHVFGQFFDNPDVLTGLPGNKNSSESLGIWMKIQLKRCLLAVDFRQRTVVPKKAVAIAGNQNRYRADNIKLV